MKAMQGLKMSYRLHELLQRQNRSCMCEAVRGVRVVDDSEVSLNDIMYTLTRANRGHRRVLLTSLLKMFDDISVCALQLYLIFVHLFQLQTFLISCSSRIWHVEHLTIQFY